MEISVEQQDDRLTVIVEDEALTQVQRLVVAAAVSLKDAQDRFGFSSEKAIGVVEELIVDGLEPISLTETFGGFDG